MGTDLAVYILLGFVQVCTAVWGGIVSARTLPSGRERNMHIAVFSIFGVIGTALIIWSGLRSYDAQKLNSEIQAQLRDDLTEARRKMDQSLQRQEYMRGQLDSIGLMVGKIREKSVDPGLKDLATAVSKLAERAAKPVPAPETQRQQMERRAAFASNVVRPPVAEPAQPPSTETFIENGRSFTRASLHDLVGLFKGHTSVQGNKAITPFKGLWVKTQGTIMMLTPNASGYFLLLKEGPDQIQCSGQTSAGQDLTQLNDGDSVRIQGTISQIQYGSGRLYLDNCEVMLSSR